MWLVLLMAGIIDLKKRIILPLHPRTKKYLKDYSIKIAENIKIIEPVGYLEMLGLEKNAKAIITDSGGVQKEAFFLKIPCFTLRNETEWIETLENGWNNLNFSAAQILEHLKTKLPEQKQFFGDGKAAEKIIEYLK